jgi:hypothetical protein
MGRSVWLASAALAMVTFCNIGYSQTATAPTSIARFDDIAGKWTGHANNHNVTLEIDAIGKFTARYALGGERGEARLARGRHSGSSPRGARRQAGACGRRHPRVRPARRQNVDGKPGAQRSVYHFVLGLPAL